MSHGEAAFRVPFDEGVCLEPEGLSFLKFFSCAVALASFGNKIEVSVFNRAKSQQVSCK